MWNAVKATFWPHTEDKDLHPPALELLGVTLHRILRFAICDDHGHFGETSPRAGSLGEAIFQNVVQSITWSKEDKN